VPLTAGTYTIEIGAGGLLGAAGAAGADGGAGGAGGDTRLLEPIVGDPVVLACGGGAGDAGHTVNFYSFDQRPFSAGGLPTNLVATQSSHTYSNDSAVNQFMHLGIPGHGGPGLHPALVNSLPVTTPGAPSESFPGGAGGIKDTSVDGAGPAFFYGGGGGGGGGGGMRGPGGAGGNGGTGNASGASTGATAGASAAANSGAGGGGGGSAGDASTGTPGQPGGAGGSGYLVLYVFFGQVAP
jgi:hypothetical protein